MSSRAARFVVTGVAGFIGSNLARTLIAEGHSVIGVDNFATGYRKNITDISDKIDFLEGDLSQPGVAAEALSGADYVLHQAAIPSVPRSVRDPLSTNTSCVDATLQVLLAARDNKVKRVVLAASSSAYGDTEVLPKSEEMPTSPLSPYAVAKLAQEHYAKSFSVCYGLETVSLRYFNVFGPRQDPDSDYAAVIPKFIRLMLNGKQPTIYGDGEQSRDFTYVDNVVQANIKAAQAEGKIMGEALNIACGERIDLNELVNKINKILETTITPVYGEPAPGDVKHSLADISRAKQLIGYEPAVGFETGLRKTAEWLRQNQQ